MRLVARLCVQMDRNLGAQVAVTNDVVLVWLGNPLGSNCGRQCCFEGGVSFGEVFLRAVVGP